MLALVGVWFGGQAIGAALFGIAGTVDEGPSATRAPAPGSPAVLIELHNCWTDAAPADVMMPGHVVVTIDGETRYAGPVMVRLALEQVFDGADHDLIVHAFCR